MLERKGYRKERRRTKGTDVAGIGRLGKRRSRARDGQARLGGGGADPVSVWGRQLQRGGVYIAIGKRESLMLIKTRVGIRVNP